MSGIVTNKKEDLEDHQSKEERQSIRALGILAQKGVLGSTIMGKSRTGILGLSIHTKI
jgi:hypothetical protein